MKISRLEEHRLSTGQLIDLTRVGHEYRVMEYGQEWMEAPVIHSQLRKAEAYRIYGDLLKNDVLEV